MAATSPTELLGERWNALRQAWDQRAPREQRLLAAGGAYARLWARQAGDLESALS